MSGINKGSEWRKWDLHVHTKDTAKNDQFSSVDFNSFCVTFFKKALENNVEAIGITDYFSIDNYRKVKAFVSGIDSENSFTDIEKEKIKTIFLLPNVELRMLPVTDNSRLVNIHCIFNPNYEICLDNDFFSTIEFSNGGGRKYKMNNQGIIDLGKNLDPSLLTDKEQYQKGVNNFVVTHEGLQKLYDENINFRENVIIIVSNSNQDGASAFQKHYDLFEDVDTSSLDGVRKAIYCISNCIFSGNNSDREYFLGLKKDNKDIVIQKCGSLKPCIHGSDAHTEDKLFSPDNNRYCWIKADPTFEGLKQIIYEPEERVKIQEHKPTDNLNKISEIELIFKEDIKIQTDGTNNSYNFCFSDVKEKLYLSDYFNCFIGGRGSGKSSLLNLIYCNITGKFDTDFLDKNRFINFEIKNDIIIDYKGEVEFLGQNQIEEFATDYVKFSKAIYERLESQEELAQQSKKLQEYIENLDDDIGYINQIEENKKLLNGWKKTIERSENIVNVIKGKEYNSLKTKLDELGKAFYEIEQSKERFNNLHGKLNEFLGNFTNNEAEKNIYDTSFNNILLKLNEVRDSILTMNFSEIQNTQEEYFEKGKEEKLKLNTFLKERGLTEEKLKDLENAQEQLHKASMEMLKLNENLKKYQDLLDILNIPEGKLIYKLYEHRIKTGLEKAESRLNAIQNQNIKKFEFQVGFDFRKAKEDLFEEFKNAFKNYQEPRLLMEKISETLFSIDIEKILDGTISTDAFIEKIKQLGFGKGNDYLKNIFELESNFEIYRIIIAKYLFNLNNYLKIDILYDSRPIEISSFGQKCTVVILIMLLFGNKPIIIDEPEAHLDSSLIANYLVDLIKQRKKERQIIFATHNANFVINGDAEQIYILENIDNKTSFTQTSIENLVNRSKLLNLEGGKEAFGLRGKKYNGNS